MTLKNNHRLGENVMNKVLFIALFAIVNLLFAASGAQAQSASPSPSPSPSSESEKTVMVGGYEVSSSIEFGVRGLSVNGNHDKYRSDFNYDNGFRIFDTSFLMENKEEGSDKLFDSLMISTTGWNADPTGSLRFNMDKTGAYRFDGNVRRFRYYNRLYNHINLGGREPGWKNADTKRNYGDFDLTIFPESEDFRLRFGGSFYQITDTAGNTTRALGDEFPITRVADVNSTEFRAGVDGKLAGFKMGLTLGYRRFNDDSDYALYNFVPNLGRDLANNDILTGFDRNNPTKGDSKYAMYTIQRNFAKKFDFSGRFIYSLTDRRSSLAENYTGRGTVRNLVTGNPAVNILSFLTIVPGSAKRPQARGDLGATYAVTDKFRISNTFSFEQFNISGDANWNELVSYQILATGEPRPNRIQFASAYRLNGFKRFVNTIEGDYQFSPKFGINIGYRYTHRRVREFGINPLFDVANNGRLIEPLEDTNSTNTFLLGTRIKPYRNWSIFADIEHGQSDNSFSRLSNYNFTNYRLRSNVNYKQFTFNVSAISRDNDNPSQTSAIKNATTGAIIVQPGELNANVKNRVFSAYVDWSPDTRFSLSTGYTFQSLTSFADIIVPSGAPDPSFVRGFSRFYMRDNYAFIDVSAQPIRRIGIFASYRFNKDRGQGDKTSNQINEIISSYPFRLHMPEIRVAFKLTRNIDWNVGYQYYGYRENLQNVMFSPIPPNQNYTAHMPYTSLRIYFGGGDR